MQNTQYEDALRALDMVAKAARSGNPAQVALAADNAARVAEAMRAGRGDMLSVPLHDGDDAVAGTARVLVDSRGVTIRATPAGQDYPFEVTVEFENGAASVILCGASWTDDVIATCKLDGGGVHVVSGASDDAARFYAGGGYAPEDEWVRPVSPEEFSARISGLAEEHSSRHLDFFAAASAYASGVDPQLADPSCSLSAMVEVVCFGKGRDPSCVADQVAALLPSESPAPGR